MYCAVNKTSTIYIYIHASIETSRKCERKYMYLLTNCINYYMKISPVDMVKGLGQCVCYNADFLCVGVCKQSSCELVIEHPTQGIFASTSWTYHRMWLVWWHYSIPDDDRNISLKIQSSIITFSVATDSLLWPVKRSGI